MITIRPDRIARTGVVRATGSYSPNAEAYATAKRFAASGVMAGARLSGWERFKLWLRTNASGADTKAIYAAAASGQPVSVALDPSAPAVPGASLPPSTAAPAYSGQSPDATQMSAMGLYITSGFHPSFIPSVVQGKAERAAALDPRLTDRPSALARIAVADDGRVGQAAWQAAARRFYAMNKSRIG